MAALVLLSVAAAASVQQRQDVATTPTVLAPQVTLGAGTVGSTTLGTSLTSAATTKSGLIVTFQEVLKIKKGTGDWDTKVNLISATGFGALDSVTVRETLGVVSENQVIVVLGVVTQTTGTAINLLASGADISLTVAGTKISSGSSVLTLQIVMTPHSGAQPAVTYNYVLTLT